MSGTEIGGIIVAIWYAVYIIFMLIQKDENWTQR